MSATTVTRTTTELVKELERRGYSVQVRRWSNEQGHSDYLTICRERICLGEGFVRVSDHFLGSDSVRLSDHLQIAAGETDVNSACDRIEAVFPKYVAFRIAKSGREMRDPENCRMFSNTDQAEMWVAKKHGNFKIERIDCA